MRKILFRGISVDDGRFYYGHYWFDNANKTHKITYDLSDDNFRCVEVIPESIGQFTGMVNSKGEEIYENEKIDYLGQECKVVFGTKTLGFGIHYNYDTGYGVTKDKFYRLHKSMSIIKKK